jgi:hypothetical protein
VTLELSDHAVDRWHERVRPGLSRDQAADDLAHQLEAFGRVARTGAAPALGRTCDGPRDRAAGPLELLPLPGQHPPRLV